MHASRRVRSSASRSSITSSSSSSAASSSGTLIELSPVRTGLSAANADPSTPPLDAFRLIDDNASAASAGAFTPTMLTQLVHSLSYDSTAFVTIRNWRIGLLYRVCQLGVLIYIIAYSLVLRKAYQTFSNVVGTADIKVKGVAYELVGNTSTAQPSPLDHLPPHIFYDAVDLVYPSTERDAVFITTNMWTTPNQTRGTCANLEDQSSRPPCTTGAFTLTGIETGQVINATLPTCAQALNMSQTLAISREQYERLAQQQPQPSERLDDDVSMLTCELETWCPAEYQPGNCTRVLHNVGNFSLFIRIDVQFPEFDVRIDNAKGALTRGVNQFYVSDVVSGAGYTYDDIAPLGAIIILDSEWSCDFDFGGVSSCEPSISFTRIDDPESNFSSGYNFRQAIYTTPSERTLIKRYGLRLVVVVSGRAGKFALVPLLTGLGAGLGLLSVATFIADIIALHLFGHRSRLYRQHKYRQVQDSCDSDEPSLLGDANGNGGGDVDDRDRASPSSSSSRSPIQHDFAASYLPPAPSSAISHSHPQYSSGHSHPQHSHDHA